MASHDNTPTPKKGAPQSGWPKVLSVIALTRLPATTPDGGGRQHDGFASCADMLSFAQFYSHQRGPLRMGVAL
jgi:hypothetical protein